MKKLSIIVYIILLSACSGTTIVDGVGVDFAQLEITSVSGEIPEVIVKVDGKSYSMFYNEINTFGTNKSKRIKIPTLSAIEVSFHYRWFGSEEYYPRSYGNIISSNVKLEKSREIESCTKINKFIASERKVYKIEFSVLGNECRARNIF